MEGAARHLQRTTEAPASVTVITASDIETFGWRTLADVLKSVRGFHMTYDRNYSYVGVRAFGRPTDYNNRVLVLVDGHRLNDSIYDGALLGTEFPVDLALVDRVEVIRGPGSALYGTSAFLAVVNVITKKGAQVGPRADGRDRGELRHLPSAGGRTAGPTPPGATCCCRSRATTAGDRRRCSSRNTPTRRAAWSTD